MIRINLSHYAADTGQMTPLSLKTVRSQASVDCVCIKQLNSWGLLRIFVDEINLYFCCKISKCK